MPFSWVMLRSSAFFTNNRKPHTLLVKVTNAPHYDIKKIISCCFLSVDLNCTCISAFEPPANFEEVCTSTSHSSGM